MGRTRAVRGPRKKGSDRESSALTMEAYMLRTRTYRVMAAVLGAAWLLSASQSAHATPSTTYWTPATSDIQAFNVWHIGVDNYFRLSTTTETLNNGQLDSCRTDIG